MLIGVLGFLKRGQAVHSKCVHLENWVLDQLMSNLVFTGDWVLHKRALSVWETGQQTDRLLMKHCLHFSSCLYQWLLWVR